MSKRSVINVGIPVSTTVPTPSAFDRTSAARVRITVVIIVHVRLGPAHLQHIIIATLSIVIMVFKL